MSDKVISSNRDNIRALPESGIVEMINYGREKEGLIPLWAGEGDRPTPDFICAAAKKSLDGGETFYTWQRGIPELRSALRTYHEGHYGRNFQDENFYVCGSGMQAIQIAVQMIAQAGDEVVVTPPVWPNIYGALQMNGARAVEAPLRHVAGEWQFDVSAIMEAVTDKTRALFLNSPGNPSGAVLSQEEIRALLSFARERGIWIISDDVYGRFFSTEKLHRLSWPLPNRKIS